MIKARGAKTNTGRQLAPGRFWRQSGATNSIEQIPPLDLSSGRPAGWLALWPDGLLHKKNRLIGACRAPSGGRLSRAVGRAASCELRASWLAGWLAASRQKTGVLNVAPLCTPHFGGPKIARLARGGAPFADAQMLRRLRQSSVGDSWSAQTSGHICKSRSVELLLLFCCCCCCHGRSALAEAASY